MLRAEEPLVLRHELEELRVLELQVVEARDVADVELVLNDLGFSWIKVGRKKGWLRSAYLQQDE